MLLLLNRNKPDPDNQGCRDGLALGLELDQDTCSVSRHIGQNSTTHQEYVNLIYMTHMGKTLSYPSYPYR